MQTPTTYAEYQENEASSKIGLAIVEASVRLTGWAVYSGSVYRVAFTKSVITSVKASGTALSAVASVGAVVAGTYYMDRTAGYLYLRTAGSVHPDSLFIAVTFRLFFSNQPVKAPYDPGVGVGHDVEWLPYFMPKESRFTTAVENSGSLLGVAVSSSSSLKLKNDQEYWAPIFDQYAWEHQRVFIYSWHRALAITEAKLVYRGRIQKKNYSTRQVGFELRDLLDELRAPVAVTDLSEYVGASLPAAMQTAKQRRLYGLVKGLVPTPIDQVLSTGWPLTGTVSLSYNTTALSGVGTSFLAQLSPGDEIYVGTAAKKVRIDSVTSDTAAVISSVFLESSQLVVSATVVPSHGKRYANRRYLVAGHALARPYCTVTQIVDSSTFYVDSTEHFSEGDGVDCAGSYGVLRVVGDGFVKLESAFSGAFVVGDLMYRSSVSKVYAGDQLLEGGRDYTYDPVTALLTLTSTAERDASTTRLLAGSAPTITVTNGSRNVTGSGTQFRTDMKPGHWIRGVGKPTWLEILEVVDDTNLILRTAAVAGDAGTAVAGEFKAPNVVDSKVVVSCDALGKPDAGGNLIEYAGAIATDLLTDAGLSGEIVASTFTDADEMLPYRLGLAIPARMKDTKVPTVRSILDTLCRSTFAMIVQNNDFQLEMGLLEPSYADTPEKITQTDLLSTPTMEGDSSAIVKTVRVLYAKKEWEPGSSGNSESVAAVENDRYLSSTEKSFEQETCLVDEDDAEMFAGRWAFIFDQCTSELTLQLKLSASRFEVNSIVEVSHPKLYQRFGAGVTNRIGAVMKVEKTVLGTSLTVHDLGNAFARVARIAPAGAAEFASASTTEKTLYGYITDQYGLTGVVAGINLIW